MGTWNKEKAVHRFALGLCVSCGKLPFVDKRKRCDICLSHQTKWRQNRSPELIKRKADRQRKWVEENREQHRQTQREYDRRLREDVITAYGGKCACCGESIFEFLTIDHKEGNGAEHRRMLGNGRRNVASATVYGWLRRNNYPKGFQVLCFNCNCAKGTSKVCPHKRYEEEVMTA